MWYDVYVQLKDDSVVMYVGIRGEEMVKVVDETTDVAASTNSIQLIVSSGLSEFRFDDIKVMTRELSDKTIAMTYGAGNQLTNIVRGDGVEVDFTYNAWGRVSHIDMEVPGVDTFTMDFVYECGNMLKRVETDVPGMPEVVEYFTDGLGKRRYKLVPDETLTCYRWDAGYNVLTEYIDDTGQWDAPDFTRFFVPKGHTAFAEGVPDANGNPIYGTYNYLAHDHLGTGRFAYDQAKDQIGMVEHDPYGERTNQTGYVPYHEYTGKPFDEETGMYYFPYRYYHPHINRWATPDPAGLVDGPNVYGYVNENPISRYDELGLAGCRGCLDEDEDEKAEGEECPPPPPPSCQKEEKSLEDCIQCCMDNKKRTRNHYKWSGVKNCCVNMCKKNNNSSGSTGMEYWNNCKKLYEIIDPPVIAVF